MTTLDATSTAILKKSALFSRASALLKAGRIDRAGFNRCLKALVDRPVMKSSPARIAAAVDAWAARDSARLRGAAAIERRASAGLRAIVEKAKAGHEAHRREATPEAPSALPFGGALEFKVIKPDWHGGRAG